MESIYIQSTIKLEHLEPLPRFLNDLPKIFIFRILLMDIDKKKKNYPKK